MDGFGITFVSIALILLFGGLLARWLRVPKEAGLVWLLPPLQPLGAELFHWSQRALTAALFLIGVGMVPAMLQ